MPMHQRIDHDVALSVLTKQGGAKQPHGKVDCQGNACRDNRARRQRTVTVRMLQPLTPSCHWCLCKRQLHDSSQRAAGCLQPMLN
jgi:hypothetical protein